LFGIAHEDDYNLDALGVARAPYVKASLTPEPYESGLLKPQKPNQDTKQNYSKET
ncbi:hypothetical protein L9F63_011335, partial [Diploptera punctata]